MCMFKGVEPKSMNCWRWGGAGSAKPYDVYARAPYETNLDIVCVTYYMYACLFWQMTVINSK